MRAPRPFLLVVLLLLPWLDGACSRESAERRDVAETGRLSYMRLCASCHGPEGRGDGPVAETLSRPPSDLTTLARRNGGSFDERAVMAFIDGERRVAEHGPRDMPVWGVVLEREHAQRQDPWPAWVALLEVRALVDYLRSIQEP